LQTALLNWLCKKKENCNVTTQFSLHSNPKVTAEPQAKVAYTTAFRQKYSQLHHTLQSKQCCHSVMKKNPRIYLEKPHKKIKKNRHTKYLKKVKTKLEKHATGTCKSKLR